MPEQERDAELERLVDEFGCERYRSGSVHSGLRSEESKLVSARIHARVAELVAQAREEGRQEGLRMVRPAPYRDPLDGRIIMTNNQTFIGDPPPPTTSIASTNHFGVASTGHSSDPPPIFTPTETGAKP